MQVGASNVQALVAALDLKLVRLIRDAIDHTDAELLRFDRCDLIDQRRRFEPEPEIEPRKTIQPSPEMIPGDVYQASPRIEPLPAVFAPPVESAATCRTKSPIEPPWKVVPWSAKFPPEPSPAPVKPRPPRPDLAVRGRLIDAIC